MKKTVIAGASALFLLSLFGVYPLIAKQPPIAKELPLLPDKQGSFTFVSNTVYTHPQCGFTKSEADESLKEIQALVTVMRKNPVLTEMKGFDSRVNIYNTAKCDDYGSYGLPSIMSYGFCSWFMDKNGQPLRITIEPPDWRIIVNKLKPSQYPFDAATYDADSNLFKIPIKKQTLRPGIDVYDDVIYVLYDPDRPAYWLPVTVREAVDKAIARWKAEPEKISADFMLKMIEQSYANFPKADWDKPARYGGKNVGPTNVIGVTADPTGLPIMRVNPEYWNKKLPRSAIQFMYFKIDNQKHKKKQMDESLKKNSINYGLDKFEASMDSDFAVLLLPLIRK